MRASRFGFNDSSLPQIPVSPGVSPHRVKELEHRVDRLTMLNQALWELLSQRLGLSEDDLRERVREVDLRDGIEDGRMSEVGLRCPTCDRVSSSKHWRCLYCGQQFVKPIMG